MNSIAVIVPLYNKRLYIDRCLNSIFAQTHENFEVIVVDDGSTDDSSDLVLARKDPRLQLIRQPNAGPGAARNHGMRATDANLVAFLDADDEWTMDYLATALKRFSSLPQPVAAVNFGMRILPADIDTRARWLHTGVPDGLFEISPQTPVATVVAILANMLPSSSVLRRQTALRLGGFYDKDRCLFSEDAHLYLKLLLHGAVYFDPNPLAIRHEDASELALNRRGVRQIEPFLRDPDDITANCPERLRPLLDEVLAARALKTASVYGYFGATSQANALFKRFVHASRHWHFPYFATALLGRTPLAGFAGAALRGISARIQSVGGFRNS